MIFCSGLGPRLLPRAPERVRSVRSEFCRQTYPSMSPAVTMTSLHAHLFLYEVTTILQLKQHSVDAFMWRTSVKDGMT